MTQEEINNLSIEAVYNAIKEGKSTLAQFEECIHEIMYSLHG